ncbi:MAG: type II toxin-antitoxin system Phd/YefM family antitoxin [Phycicoccus sp.]
MNDARRTFRSSELSRNSREVFEAADRGPVLITRRDGAALVLSGADEADRSRRGLELAAAVVGAALGPDHRPIVERLRGPFPWMAFLSQNDQAALATEVVDVARACAAIAQFDPLLRTADAWRASAQQAAAASASEGDPAARATATAAGRPG